MANMSEPKHWSGYVVECYDCGFVYDSWHTLEGGGYDCPACNELALGTENRRLNSRVFVILEDNKQLRERINVMLKCLDGGMDEEEKYNQQQLLHEIKVIAKGEWKGGGSDG